MCGGVKERDYQCIMKLHYGCISDELEAETKQAVHSCVESRRVLTCSSNSLRDIRAVRYSRSTSQYWGAFGPNAETSWCLVVVVDGRDMARITEEDGRGSNCAAVTVVATSKRCSRKRPRGRSPQNGNAVCMKCRHAGAYERNADLPTIPAHPPLLLTSLDDDTIIYNKTLSFILLSVFSLVAIPHDLFLSKEAIGLPSQQPPHEQLGTPCDIQT